MKTHELKTWPDVYEAMASGAKTAEYRHNDRKFKEGDMLMLQEFDPRWKHYTGRSVAVIVTHITYGGRFGIPDGYVMMSVAFPKEDDNHEAGNPFAP